MKTEVRRTYSETRKIRKPLMEKKRRARINDSLETLKQMLLDTKSPIKEGKNGQRTAKLEKADILEMTVQYLQSLHSKLSNVQKTERASKESLTADNKVQETSGSDSSMKVMIYPTKLPNGQVILVVPAQYQSSANKQDGKELTSAQQMKLWRPW